MEPIALDQLCQIVRNLIDDPSARLSIAIETAEDEAFFIGTSDAYLRLALAALEFVFDAKAGRAEILTINGIKVADTSSFGDAIKPGDVGLAGGWLATSADDAREVAEYIQWLSPPADNNG